MVNKSSNNPKEFTILNCNVPSSTTVVIGSSSIGRSSITKLVFKLNQQLVTLQHEKNLGFMGSKIYS
jgi:hypothetical protein